MSTTKRRAASTHGKPPPYARPTRASITRTTADHGNIPEGKLRCTRKACSCSEDHSLTARPTPPKTRAGTGSNILGKYAHDRAGRMGRGRGYRPGQIGIQAGKGPSQLLQDRIRQLARDIKDKHVGKATEDIEASSDSSQAVTTEEQIPTNISGQTDASQIHKFGPPDSSNANAAEIFRSRQINRHRTTSENSQTVWESEESEDITGDKLSENKTESRPSHEEDSVQPSDSQTKEPTPPASPPPQRRTRRSAVFEPPKIELNKTESHTLFDESRTRRSEHAVPLIVQPTQEPELNERSHSPVQNTERTESDLSSNSNTITEETVPLIVEYPPDLPARYRSQGPSISESLAPSDMEDTDFPGLQRIRKISQSHSDNLDVPRTRFKSRTPSLVPTGAPLLGWAPAVGAGRGRSNSVINISSSYMARRSSVFGLSMNAGYRKDSVGTRSLSNSPTQSRRGSVADIFRRSRQSRNRRLSAYLQSYTGKERAIERLKRISKTVRIVAGICLALKSYVKTAETKQWSLIEMHLNLRADMEKTLAFDPIMFSKLRVTRGSEKLRGILSAKSSERTKEDIDVVLALLRKNKTFADYDRDTQIALAKVMEYLRYEPRRIILKEGHQASGFYIILSGTCLVNQKEIDPRNNETFVRTIDEIHAGDSFGDNELLNDCVRVVSVVCKDECEVLLVDKEDFNLIIREPLERERVKLLHFCSKQNVFEKLPTNLDFRGNNYAISAKKYKPGVVITSDISESDYIYVVQSGKCRVISEVKEIKRRAPSAKNVTRKPINDEGWKKDATLKRTLTVFETMGNRRKCVSEPKPAHIERQKTFFSLSGIKKTVDFVDSDETEDPPALPKTLFDEKDQLQTKPNLEEPPDKSGMTTTWRRVSMAASAISQKEKRSNPLLYLKPSRLKSTYAEVAVLTEGDVFGVETLVTSSQSDTRLSLVSEGVDCIVISKKFFATQATVSTIQQSTKKAIDYPSAEYTLNKIRQARAWSSYKESLVREVCNHKLSKAGELSR
ncbi:uncharacterized protein LOC119728471 isoform X2 [Patiria miniata]|uniref:Cyclic nucleotide-binding domain-containing protein n=1 Tax=Patiria miniata TaxID=46514 RepID=A0A914A000_PATMI|nr:uncharacterized protein LOC119728471 isoform X2 [Patiria miniata]